MQADHVTHSAFVFEWQRFNVTGGHCTQLWSSDGAHLVSALLQLSSCRVQKPLKILCAGLCSATTFQRTLGHVKPHFIASLELFRLRAEDHAVGCAHSHGSVVLGARTVHEASWALFDSQKTHAHQSVLLCSFDLVEISLQFARVWW